MEGFIQCLIKWILLWGYQGMYGMGWAGLEKKIKTYPQTKILWPQTIQAINLEKKSKQ